MNKPNYLESKKRCNKEVKIIRDFKIDESLKHIGDNKTYYVRTYGCQMNERDSENICALLEELGYTRNNDMESSDLVILNTCAIRENVHNKVFGLLGRLKYIKSKRDIIVGLCGCMAQEESVVDKIIDKYKWIDFVFGTFNIHELPIILNNAIKTNKQQIEVYNDGDIIEDIPIKRESNYKAWINIMFGCDKFCTYCIVPYTRGKQKSRLKE
ncbi:MAG TPA: tRNA (N6-isopentenyl adenosine(37)-C2)-methylthiotransferase MiaB, partial [Bacilli bacterium]|nr:tRNA (N6-isopentenyl adenosine(37)-C2)-methylthiotransferase MiaB [Bacilli bacterium]